MKATRIASRDFVWRDLEEAFSLAVDTWGYSRIEFDTAQLRDEDYPTLGLLTQRFGVSVSFRATLDLAAIAPEQAVAALDALRERCEEALADDAVVEMRATDSVDELMVAGIVAAARPGYEAAGIALRVEGVSPGSAER